MLLSSFSVVTGHSHWREGGSGGGIVTYILQGELGFVSLPLDFLGAAVTGGKDSENWCCSRNGKYSQCHSMVSEKGGLSTCKCCFCLFDFFLGVCVLNFALFWCKICLFLLFILLPLVFAICFFVHTSSPGSQKWWSLCVVGLCAFADHAGVFGPCLDV